MIFRTVKGTLIDIKRESYLNDRDYYRAILEIVYEVQLPINSLNNYLTIY